MDVRLTPPREGPAKDAVSAFMDQHIYPKRRCLPQRRSRPDRAKATLGPTVIMEQLKDKARAAGLWNLFLAAVRARRPPHQPEYAPYAKIMGRSHIAPEASTLGRPDHRQHGKTIER